VPTVSVVIPVKDGARFLGQVLAALRDEGPEEVLVIDSGSSDGSERIARDEGVDVIQLRPEEFGHGRTRNLGVDRTSGDLVCFLTQDATPVHGWLAAYIEAFALDERIGAAFGPHLPRPDTSPMIARELTEFFAGFAPAGRPTIQRALDEASWHPGFLSNVNAAYRRAALEEIPFRDVPYSEDQAYARDLFAAGWLKAYHPDAGVLHAHDYPWAEFMRRYFDEYRGLRETIGHVEQIGGRSTVRLVRRQVAADRRWMEQHDTVGRSLWTARSAAHHAGRRVFSALGSRSERLPDGLQRRLSLEGRAGTPRRNGALPTDEITSNAALVPAPRHVSPRLDRPLFEEIQRYERAGAAPLLDPLPGMAERERLHIAVVIPPFRIGSGGHNSIFQICLGLERQGHTVSIWLHDPSGVQASEWPAVVRDTIRRHFAPLEAPVYKGFDHWFGADVVVATGWQTVFEVTQLKNCRARAYLVHDHENEFYPTSAESIWAEATYRLGLFHIAASPWLKSVIEDKYGGAATVFDFGVDHDVYRPLDVPRRRDTVLFYSRHVTPRRAVPLGLLALAELHRRRPDVRVVFFGDRVPPPASFSFEDVGIASQTELAALYNEATVGLVLSLTNYSLVPQEMLACGLPCVDLAGFCSETVFGRDGPVELAGFDADAIADAIERLLDDEPRWQARSDAGRAFVREHTWESASRKVEAALREALRERESGSA
jgi:glycosyltransferase involved in cell wall biosynthesis